MKHNFEVEDNMNKFFMQKPNADVYSAYSDANITKPQSRSAYGTPKDKYYSEQENSDAHGRTQHTEVKTKNQLFWSPFSTSTRTPHNYGSEEERGTRNILEDISKV